VGDEEVCGGGAYRDRGTSGNAEEGVSERVSGGGGGGGHRRTEGDGLKAQGFLIRMFFKRKRQAQGLFGSAF
jgi:hypothetical protein